MKMIQIDEVCVLCGLDKNVLIHFIEEEWVKPAGNEKLEMDEEDIARIQLIRELKEDFGVNDEGMSIILHLLDQLNWIRVKISERSGSQY